MKKMSTLLLGMLVLFITSLIPLHEAAQTVSNYTFSSYQVPYTPLSGGTVYGTSTTDDQCFIDPTVPAGAAGTTGVGIPIGFNFVFAGDTFDVIGINANGWISFGKSSLSPSVNMASSNSYYCLPSTSTITPNLLRDRIAGVARDLQGRANSSITVQTIGTSPNQTCVIEWGNYIRYNVTGDTLNFQIRLNETSNIVEVAFGNMVFSSASNHTGNSNSPQVGLGGKISSDFNSRTTTTDWNNTSASTINTQGCDVNSSGGVAYPLSGFTMAWTPPTCGAPTAVSVANVGSYGGTAHWTLGYYGSPQDFDWVIVPQGNTPGNGVLFSGDITAPADSLVLSGLTAGTPYSFYIRSVCGAGDTSNFSSAVNFTTIPTCFPPTAVNISNVSSDSAVVHWTLPTQGTPQAYLWTLVPQGNGPTAGVIASGSVADPTDSFDLTGISPSTNFTIYIRSLCSVGDTSAYTSAVNFTTLCVAYNVPWNDGFETSVTATGASTVSPSCWAISTTSGTSWRSNTAAVRNGVGARAGVKYEYATYGSVGWLFTPGINLTGGTSYEFSFWYNNTDVTNPGFTINIAYGNGQTSGSMTTSLGSLVNTTNTTYQQFLINFTPATTGVYNFGIQDSTPSFTPWYLTFDDFQVRLTPPCPSPTAVTVAATDTTATITWTSTGINSNIEYGPNGFTPGTGTFVYGVTSPYTITGLTSQTAYSVYVTDSCTGTLSTPTGPANFTTQCSPYPYPGNTYEGAIVVNSYPFADTIYTTDPCFTDASPLRSGIDAFYKIVADSCATEITFSLCGSDFDTYLYIQDSSNTNTLYTNDDFCGLQSQITFTPTPGSTYYAVVEPYSSTGTGTVIASATQTTGSPPAINTSFVSPSCAGIADGSASVSITSFGTSPVTYSWSNGGTSDTISNITSGTYYVTVTTGCGSAIDTVVVPPAFQASLTSVTNVSCNGGTNGAIDVTVSNGTLPYVFNWSNSATTEDLSGLQAGTYDLTVTENGGCTSTLSAVVTEPDPIAITDSVTNVLCHSDSTGAVNITVTGGTFNPSINSQLSTTFAGGNNCGGGNMFDLQANTDLQITGIDVNLTSSGTVNIYVKPGTYTGFVTTPAAWTLVYTTNVTNLGTGTPTPITFNTPISLPAGSYGVFVNGDLTYTNMALGTTYSTPELTLTVGDGLCSAFGGTNPGRVWNGNIHYTVPGIPYSYLWSTGDTTEDISSLPAGAYDVTITDGNSCTATASYTITEPATSLAVTLDSLMNVSCYGLSDGAVYVSVSGGTGAYTYTWSSGATTEDLINVPAGNYSGTVTDANGCIYTSPVAIPITQPDAIAISIDSIRNVSCNGGNDGGINITATGGIGSYTYLWSDNSTLEDLMNAVADSFMVTVTDSTGCAFSSSMVAVSEPTALTVTLDSIMNNLCAGGTEAGIYITPAGGTSPYSFAWSNSTTAEDLTQVAAGEYTVSLTDANGCSALAMTDTITDPAPLVAAVDSSMNVSCFGGANGAIYVSVTGQSGMVGYVWDNTDSTNNISGLMAGIYNMTATDENGCTASLSQAVTEPSSALSATSTTTAQIQGGASGTVNVTTSGGTSPYSYLWNNAATTEDLSSVNAGTYTLTITDANGCQFMISDTVDFISGIEGVAGNFALNIYPNPTQNVVFLDLKMSNANNVTIEIHNVEGQIISKYEADNVLSKKFELDFTNQAAGIYTAKIIVGGATLVRRIAVTR